jgi:RHO1 GDP-GTP exchange protein 1/2
VVYTLASVLLSIVSRRNYHLSYLQFRSPPAFHKVLEFNEPNSIVAIPGFNKFIVHCELALSSYPLDKVIRVSRARNDAAFQDLGASEEGLTQSDGDVLFLKVGSIADETVGK